MKVSCSIRLFVCTCNWDTTEEEEKKRKTKKKETTKKRKMKRRTKTKSPHENKVRLSCL